MSHRALACAALGLATAIRVGHSTAWAQPAGSDVGPLQRGYEAIQAAGREAADGLRAIENRANAIAGEDLPGRPELARVLGVYAALLAACDAAAQGKLTEAAMRARDARGVIGDAPPTPALRSSFARDTLAALSQCTDESLANAARAGEEAVRQAANAEVRALQTVPAMGVMSVYDVKAARAIEQHRKSDAVVTVTRDGRPLPGVDVQVRQVSHEFLFGCAVPNFDGVARWPEDTRRRFEELYLRLFNYATTENACKWTGVESERGQYNYAQIDRMAEWCREQGVVLKGHTLVWGNRGGQGVPRWLEPLPADEVNALVEEHVRTMVRRYRGRIDYWDVINEPTHCHWYDAHDRDYALHSLQSARQESPDAVLIVNDFGEFVGNATRFRDYAKGLLAKGAPLDAIGLQAHDPPNWYSPQRVFETLDTLAEVGVDLHITEFTFRSNGEAIRGGFVEGNWDEEKHGEFYDMFYRYCFSHPRVKAITMWAMWDGSSWQQQGGIVRRDLTPKPAYEALNRLINQEWRTTVSAETDADGRLTFRGFHGRYEAVAVHRGVTRTAHCRVASEGENRLELAF